MGKAQMSNDLDKSNETDDLIAELARLMAQDAKGENSRQKSNMQKLQLDNVANDGVSSQEGSNKSDVGFEEVQANAPQIEKTLEKVLSASERLSAIKSAKENAHQIANQKHDRSFQDRISPDIASEQNFSQDENQNKNHEPAPQEEKHSDPIAELILKQLEQEKLSSSDIADDFAESSNVEQDTDIRNLDDKNQNIRAENFFGEKVEANLSNNDVSDNEDILAENLSNKEKEELDPLIEIERLIGEAVREGGKIDESANNDVGDALKIEKPVQNISEAASAAESTISAIAVESEKNIDVEEIHQDKSVNETKETNIKPSFVRSIIGPSIAAIILLAAGFGLYYFFDQNGSDNVAPILKASNEPEKAAPEPTNTKDSEQSIVLSEISGEEKKEENERLVPRDESQDNIINSQANEPRIITNNSEPQTVIANRKVKTVTVRPDGTIVSGDSSRAGNEALPVDRPNVPDLPAGVTNAAAEQADQPITSNQQQILVANAGEAASGDNEQTASQAASSSPAPQTRPEESANNNGGTSAVNLLADSTQQSAESASQIITGAPTSQQAQASLTVAPAYVQLSSQRAHETAQRSLIELRTRFAAILGNEKLEIQRADLGDKGIYYRVRMPAQSIEYANNICNNIKLAGGDCFVRTD